MAHTRQINDSASTGSSWSRRVVRRSGLWQRRFQSSTRLGNCACRPICLLVQTIASPPLRSRASMVSNKRSRRSTPRRLRRAPSVGALGGGASVMAAMTMKSGVDRMSRAFYGSLAVLCRRTLAIPVPWADLRSRSKEGRTECIAFSCTWMDDV